MMNAVDEFFLGGLLLLILVALAVSVVVLLWRLSYSTVMWFLLRYFGLVIEVTKVPDRSTFSDKVHTYGYRFNDNDTPTEDDEAFFRKLPLGWSKATGVHQFYKGYDRYFVRYKIYKVHLRDGIHVIIKPAEEDFPFQKQSRLVTFKGVRAYA